MHALLHSAPPTLMQATTDPCLHQSLLNTHRQVWISLLWGHCSFLLSPGAHKFFFCALQESVSPVLYKFWQLYGGVNGSLLQAGLCHTQVYCTQSSCPVAVTVKLYLCRRHRSQRPHRDWDRSLSECLLGRYKALVDCLTCSKSNQCIFSSLEV